jgi:hypothetical protein
MADMVKLTHRKRWAEAVELGRRLSAEAPHLPQPRYNLAVALRELGREEETEEILEELVERFPDYLFARAALVALRVEQERLDEADELVRTAPMPKETTLEGQAAWAAAQVELAIARKDSEGMRQGMAALRSIDPGHPLLEDLDASPAGAVVAFLDRLEENRRRREERARARLLAPAATAADCLSALTVPELQEVARGLGIGARGRRSAVLKAILEAFRDPEAVRLAVARLPENTRAELARLVAAGGVEPFADFTRRGDALGALRRAGLVAVGTVGGTESVVVPGDLRPILEAALVPARPL